MQKSLSPSGAHQRDGRSIGHRPLLQSLLRGAHLKCPACGTGALFRRYLKVADTCPYCGEALYHHRADDAPAYFTVVVVGHVVVALVLAVEMAFRPPLWLHAALWLPLPKSTASTYRVASGVDPLSGGLACMMTTLPVHGARK